MSNTSLYSISPIDGRYHSKTAALSNYFTEYALIKYRVRVEVLYFIALIKTGVTNLPSLSPEILLQLEGIYVNFSEDDANWIKDSEKITNHDVKAVEYFLKDKFTKLGLDAYLEYVHFGLTSQDINNTSIPL